MAIVNLYEDNAGGLYLHMVGSEKVYGEIERVAGSRFSDDAAAIASGDTSDWTVETFPADQFDFEGPALVAQWGAGEIEMVGQAGRSAEQYLGQR